MSGQAYVLRLSGFAFLYFVLTRVSDSLLVFLEAGEPVTPVWPPAGVALAGLLLLGYRFWPIVPLGHALALLTTLDHPPLPLATLALIAVGNTLAALIPAFLLRRFTGFHPALDRLNDVLALLVIGALLNGALAAIFGATSLLLTHVIPAAAWDDVWRVWAVGNVLGVLTVSPIVLVYGVRSRLGAPHHRWVAEVAALAASTVAVSVLVFQVDAVQQYAIFPVLVWAALRFGQRGAATAMVIVVGTAIYCTTRGHGPFAHGVMSERLIALQVFIGIVAVTVLILAATVSERQRAQAGLRQANEELESRVVERTAQLSTAYDHLNRLHEQGLEYLREVDKVTGAAAAVESGEAVPDSVSGVSERPDALGQLARVFRRMADEVYAREHRLKQQVAQLRIEIDEAKKERQVAEITETDYFQRLRERAQQLRNPGGA